MRAYPDGLTIVAGNAHAGTAQSRRVVFWDCGVVKTTLYGTMARDSQPVATPPAASSTPPSCPPASKLQLHVNFPDCWNGKTIDSVDHKRHMAYSVDGRCPRSHPVAVPELSLVYQYPPLTGIVALSSGSVYSAHADFVNAWDEDALKALVAHCLNALRPCGTGLLARYFGRRATIAFASFASNAGDGAWTTDVMISTVSAWPAPWRIRSR